MPVVASLFIPFLFDAFAVIIHVIQINQTQSRASISMFASFFFIQLNRDSFVLHCISTQMYNVHIQFRKLIDLHVLSSVKLYKHPFLVWMLFSLHAWEIQSGTAVKEHYATATAHFASFSALYEISAFVMQSHVLSNSYFDIFTLFLDANSSGSCQKWICSMVLYFEWSNMLCFISIEGKWAEL